MVTSKITQILLGISYRIQIGLAYCNGPKGAGRGSEKPTCTTKVTRGLLDRLHGRLADITVVRAAQLAIGPRQIAASSPHGQRC